MSFDTTSGFWREPSGTLLEHACRGSASTVPNRRLPHCLSEFTHRSHITIFLHIYTSIPILHSIDRCGFIHGMYKNSPASNENLLLQLIFYSHYCHNTHLLQAANPVNFLGVLLSKQTFTASSNAVTFLRELLPQHTLTAGSKDS